LFNGPGSNPSPNSGVSTDSVFFEVSGEIETGGFWDFNLRVDVWKKGVYGFVCYSGSLGVG